MVKCQYCEIIDALRELYEENLEYSSINHLGAHNNHAMRRARKALGLPEWIEVKPEEQDPGEAPHYAGCAGGWKRK